MPDNYHKFKINLTFNPIIYDNFITFHYVN